MSLVRSSPVGPLLIHALGRLIWSDRRHLLRLWLRDPDDTWKMPQQLRDRWVRAYNDAREEEQEVPFEPQLRQCQASEAAGELGILGLSSRKEANRCLSHASPNWRRWAISDESPEAREDTKSMESWAIGAAEIEAHIPPNGAEARAALEVSSRGQLQRTPYYEVFPTLAEVDQANQPRRPKWARQIARNLALLVGHPEFSFSNSGKMGSWIAGSYKPGASVSLSSGSPKDLTGDLAHRRAHHGPPTGQSDRQSELQRPQLR